MKRQALSHIKTHRLMRLLQIPLYQAVGLLEVIWCHAEEHYHDGALRGLRAADIAALTGWQGDDESLLSALIDAGWIDRLDDGTLLVHDWHEHCADHIHMRLARSGQRFANGSEPKKSRLAHGERTASAQRAHSVRTASAQRAHSVRTTQDPRPKTSTSSCGDIDTPSTPLPPNDDPPPPPLVEKPVEIMPISTEAEQTPSEQPPPLKLPIETALMAQMGRVSNGKPLDLDAKLPPDKAIGLVRLMLRDWMERQAGRLPPPDDELCRRLLQAHGMSLDGLRDWLLSLRRRGKRPESVQSWGWFAHLAEAEAARDGPAVALAAAGGAA